MITRKNQPVFTLRVQGDADAADVSATYNTGMTAAFIHSVLESGWHR